MTLFIRIESKCWKKQKEKIYKKQLKNNSLAHKIPHQHKTSPPSLVLLDPKEPGEDVRQRSDVVEVVEDDDGWKVRRLHLALFGHVGKVLVDLLAGLTVNIERGDEGGGIKVGTRPSYIFSISMSWPYVVHSFIHTSIQLTTLNSRPEHDVLRQLLSEECFSRSTRSGQNDPAMLQHEGHVPLHDRLWDQSLEGQTVHALFFGSWDRQGQSSLIA